MGSEDTSRLFRELFDDVVSGRIDRRAFARRALASGMSAAVALHVIQGLAKQTPEAEASAPAVGMDGTARGEGGELRIIQWQAPTLLGQHSAQGGKDNLAAAPVLEPLTSFLENGTQIPTLVQRMPTVENGLLAEDSSSVTYELLEGVTWSDGEPFTADDVKFTWEWVTNPDNAATTFEIYSIIKGVEVVDETTVTFDFGAPQPAWYVPFSGSWWGAVYPKHLLEGSSTEEYTAFLSAPVGTGPYVVESFSPGDQVNYVANENYRDPNKPFFATVLLKGGGDAAAAARSVLQTGEFDAAWNLQVDPKVLQEMEAAGVGKVLVSPGGGVETIYINFADPHTEVDGEFASITTPHPFLTDINVRRALALATNSELISDELYQEGEEPTPNVLVGIERLESPNTSRAYDPDQAMALLEEAGWVLDGDVRTKDGVELSVTYNTTVNQVRQQTQAIVKQGLESIGVRVELKQTDASIYFDRSPGNTQSYIHFYDDLGMSQPTVDSPFPLAYMNRWYAGPDLANIAQQANDWSGQNLQRFVNEEYDALFEQVQVEVDPEKSAELFIAMNDIIVNEQVVIPVVQRASEVMGLSNRILADNIAVGSFETTYWNIANWTLAE